MNIQHNISLKNYNTFGIDVSARDFVAVSNTNELLQVLQQNKKDLFILGGGSNMLLTKNIEDALVVHIHLKGKTVIDENDDYVWIQASAGENWHEFILWCIDNGYGGLENMSLIPGNIGTAPIQNIGAYGKELKDNFIECEAVEITTGSTKTFNKKECEFGYRNSVFKNELKGQYIITAVTFKLTKKNHALNTGYGAIENELADKNITNPSIKEISNAVIAIRQSKLPDPKILGNSGSFFKNPVISQEYFKIFNNKFPEAPFYEVKPTQSNSKLEYKIPAGWLIEKTGFKGKQFGDAGVHKNQALVLVNYGNASGKEIWDLAMKIKTAVFEQFGIEINPEVNIY
ncbi:MAG: UDP-N-acetylenolpyruvoylglucosamine reductase [Kordia sp.]|nr:MAG: UDP-N-acetylenolpyruvoylglucosamine reductase [Kordia sp.]